MMPGSRSDEFIIDGLRYSLCAPSRIPTGGELERHQVPSNHECHRVLTRMVESPASLVQLRTLFTDLAPSASTPPTHRVLIERLAAEIDRGRLVLWHLQEDRDVTLVADVEPAAADLNDMDDEPEETSEDPLHVMVRLHYDPDRPEAWDDKLRLFSTDDEGGTYDQEVDLASEDKTQREGRHLLVLFEDVVPGREYSCFLDLGRTEGGYLVFHRHHLSRRQAVRGLPRDVG